MVHIYKVWPLKVNENYLLAKWERCGEGEAKYCVMEEECDRRIWLS
jgi:hypothetical protein